MTLDEWLNSYTANGDAQFVCAWRKRAWRALRVAVEKFVMDRDAGIGLTAADLFAAIEAARHDSDIPADGKRWKHELQKLTEIIRVQRELWPAPSSDEYAVCEVAIDLVEQDDCDGALKLLDEQAPRRLNRGCPACGVQPGERCVAGPQDRWSDGQINYRVVPHLARVVPARSSEPSRSSGADGDDMELESRARIGAEE